MSSQNKDTRITAEDRNAANKVIKDFKSVFALAETIERVGNIQQSEAEAEAKIKALKADAEEAKAVLSAVNENVKKARAGLAEVSGEADKVRKSIASMKEQEDVMEKRQVASRAEHEGRIASFTKDEEAAAYRIEVADANAKAIIARSHKVTEEAAREKAEAASMTKAVEAKKAELHALERKILDTKEAMKAQFDQVSRNLG